MMVVPFCGVQTGVQIDHQGKNTYNEGTPMVEQRSDGGHLGVSAWLRGTPEAH